MLRGKLILGAVLVVVTAGNAATETVTRVRTGVPVDVVLALSPENPPVTIP